MSKISIDDFIAIRQSKIIVDDLTKAIEEVERSINALQPHKKYGNIRDILISMYDSVTYLEIHLAKHKDVLKRLGYKEKEEE